LPARYIPEDNLPIRPADASVEFIGLKARSVCLENSTLASAGRDGQIILWDVASRQPIGRDIAGNKIAIGSLALSPDGRRLAAVSCTEEEMLSNANGLKIRVWDISAESWIARAWRHRKSESDEGGVEQVSS